MKENNVIIPKFYKDPIKEYKREFRIFNAGWVVYYDHYGSDTTPLVAARQSTGNQSGEDAKKDAGSRSYLWRKGHVSPFEQAGLSIIFQVPISIARQILRHRSLHVNEHSMRYSEPLFEFYVPEPELICYDNEINKQSSGQPVDSELAWLYIFNAEEFNKESQNLYENFRKQGVAKERARDFMPVSSYTRIMATANIRDWFFFLSKRLKPDAQAEVRIFSECVYEMLRDLFPLCTAEFEEHTLHSEQLSRTDLVVLKEYMQVLPNLTGLVGKEEMFDSICAKNNLNKSRTRELKQKLRMEF